MGYDTVTADEFESEIRAIRREHEKALNNLREDVQLIARRPTLSLVQNYASQEDVTALSATVDLLSTAILEQAKLIARLARSVEELVYESVESNTA